MKKSILILVLSILTLSFASCKKKDCPAPTTVVAASPSNVSSTSSIRILIESTVSTADGRLDGDIQLVTDTVNDVIAFQKHFINSFGGSTYTFDTTIVVTSSVLNINALLYTEKFTGSIYDIDMAADTYMTVWVDGAKKIFLKNSVIAQSINLK